MDNFKVGVLADHLVDDLKAWKNELSDAEIAHAILLATIRAFSDREDWQLDRRLKVTTEIAVASSALVAQVNRDIGGPVGPQP